VSFCFVLRNLVLLIFEKYKKGMHVDVDSKDAITKVGLKI
jgi:hypothetical protein